jgi:hypothetical protein
MLKTNYMVDVDSEFVPEAELMSSSKKEDIAN